MNLLHTLNLLLWQGRLNLHLHPETECVMHPKMYMEVQDLFFPN